MASQELRNKNRKLGNTSDSSPSSQTAESDTTMATPADKLPVSSC